MKIIFLKIKIIILIYFEVKKLFKKTITKTLNSQILKATFLFLKSIY